MAHVVHLSRLVHLIHVVNLLHLIHLVDLVHRVELLLHRGMVVHAGLHRRGCCLRCTMLLVSASRVGIAVDAGVARQLIGSAESLRTARELARMRFLPSMSANMSRLVLETMESLVAQWTLVGSRQIRAMLLLILHRAHWRHSHGRSRHRRGCR